MSFGVYIVFHSVSNGLDDGYDIKLFPVVFFTSQNGADVVVKELFRFVHVNEGCSL